MKLAIQEKNKTGIGFLMVMIVAFFWAVDGTLIRPLLHGIPAPVVVFIEYVIGLIILSPIFFINWKKIRSLTYKDIFSIIVIGLVGGTIGTTMITKALFAAYEAGIAFSTIILLQKLQPFFVIFLAWILLKEKLPRGFYFWATIAIMAAYFLSFGKSGVVFSDLLTVNRAILFAVIAGFAYACSTVFGKRLLNHLDYQTAAALRYLATAAFLFIFIFINGDIKSIASISATQVKYLLMIGLLSVVGFLMYYYALKATTASLTAIGELFWSFSAIILDYYFNGNFLNYIQLIAVAVLFSAFYFVVKKGRPKLPSFKALALPAERTRVNFRLNTVNLGDLKLDLDYGVYAVKTAVGEEKHNGLLHFGHRRTPGCAPIAELYLPRYVGNYYGVIIKVKIVSKIRDTMKFNNDEDLIKQINLDLKELDNIK